MILINFAEYLGVFVFAISGGLVAIRHDMDLFGILIVSLLPAVGGGTLRDILLDVEVFWLNNPTIIYTALSGGIGAILYKSWTNLRLFIWVDALGLSLFAIMGTVKAYSFGFDFLASVIMGTITATAGGIIRDIVCGETPLVLKKEIYATAALIGSIICYALFELGFHTNIAIISGFLTVFSIRATAIILNLSLPRSDWVQKKIHSFKKK